MRLGELLLVGLVGLVCVACGEAETGGGSRGGGTGGFGNGTGGLLGGGGGAGGTFGNGTGAVLGTGAVPGGGGVIGMTTDGGMDEGCSSVKESAEIQRGAVDIVWVIDNSGSMGDEIAAVQTNINNFANDISSAGVDHHVVMITEMNVAAGTPLGGDPQHYLHRPVSVGSRNPLQILINDFPNYQSFLRPGAPTHFIAVTDDESNVASADFQTQMETLLGHEFILHAIASEDVNGFACAGACGIPFACGASAPGLQYYALADATGGEKISICTADWSQVFAPLQQAVIESVPLPCNYDIPPPPSGETLDPNLVNVRYTGADNMPQTFPRADGEAQCSDLAAWYYDDPQDPAQIKLCPTACTTVEGGGAISIAFGCETVPVQ